MGVERLAAATRGGDVRGVIFPSDRGSEYASRKFARACSRLGSDAVHGPGRLVLRQRRQRIDYENEYWAGLTVGLAA